MSEAFGAALSSSDTVAVVGVGNVALDCARILAKGEKGLATLDLDLLAVGAASSRCLCTLQTGNTCIMHIHRVAPGYHGLECIVCNTMDMHPLLAQITNFSVFNPQCVIFVCNCPQERTR